MLETSILHSKLKDFNYYVQKLPMFLQQSHGFIEHYRIWYDMLVGYKEDEMNNTGIVGMADTLFNLLNIFDQDIDDNGNIINHYLEYLNSLAEKERAKFDNELDFEQYRDYTSDILEKIGSLFGVKREFTIKYDDGEGEKTRHVYLTNHDLLLLIKAQIIKNYCDGSYEQIKQYYKTVGLYVYITTASESATSNVYLVHFTSEETAYQPSENVQAMFFVGLLTIQSMGIQYRHAFVNLDTVLIWDNESSTWGWGDGSANHPGGTWVL